MVTHSLVYSRVWEYHAHFAVIVRLGRYMELKPSLKGAQFLASMHVNGLYKDFGGTVTSPSSVNMSGETFIFFCYDFS